MPAQPAAVADRAVDAHPLDRDDPHARLRLGAEREEECN